MNKFYTTILLCLICVFGGYGAEPSSVLPYDDFLGNYIQDPKDLLPPKNSDRYLEIKGFKVVMWVKKNQFGKTANDLKQFSGDVKLGIDRFELIIYNNESQKKEVEEVRGLIRGKFEFVKRKNTSTDEVIYDYINAGTTITITFSYLFNKVSSVGLTVTDGSNYIGLIANGR